MYKVRENTTGINLSGGFRDELVATAMTLSLLIVGSFVLTDRVFFASKNPAEEKVIADAVVNPQTLGATDVQPEVINAMPTPSPLPDPLMTVTASSAGEIASSSALVASASAVTEGSMVISEVPFGEDGTYDFAAYTITFSNPHIVFDATDKIKRKLIVDVSLYNKSVLEGLDARVSASIVKDGIVIVPKAAMHVTNRQMVGVNQTLLFQAEINLVEATDVRELRYEPGGDLPSASHFLYP